MGLYAQGDVKKMVYISEDEEDRIIARIVSTVVAPAKSLKIRKIPTETGSYEREDLTYIVSRNTFYTRRSKFLSFDRTEMNYDQFQRDILKNRLRLKRPLPVSDEADRPFWAEDELSGSESRPKLHRKQKRRSLSHRNRATTTTTATATGATGNSTLIFHSTSSSTDSARLRTFARNAPERTAGKRGLRRLGIESIEERGAIKRKRCRRNNKEHLKLVNSFYSGPVRKFHQNDCPSSSSS